VCGRPGVVAHRDAETPIVAGVIPDDEPDGDWTAPGVFRCAPGVYRIPLPLPNDGLRAVNIYAVADGDGWTLIDSGWALARADDLLRGALAQLGSALSDVRRFLVTHVHRDHYTQAVVLRREFGMRVALGRGEQPALEVINRPDREGPAHLARLRRAGGQALLPRIAAQREAPHDSTVWEFPDDWIEDGAEFVLDAAGGEERVLQALATPGHTQGHVVFADPSGGLLFSGDHVLPRITPSIGFEAVTSPRPLADFIASLELVRARPDAAMLPAHGPVGMRVHERVDELLAHHGKRLDATLSAVQDGRSTAYEVAEALPWTRRDRRLDELDPFNAMLATLETSVHLDLLAERGLVTAGEENGIAHYTT
jgi:glyoxylase-like metal-dependent hydrolase (beta-lactamase superfamily II)